MTPEDTAGIETKEDLIRFLDMILADFADNGDNWENQDISSFVEAFQSWLEVSQNYYKNTGIPVASVTPWKEIADALAAARIYE